MVNVEIHATSHVGRVRRGNEDNYLLLNISTSKAWTSSQDNGEFVIESQVFDVDDNGIVMAVSDGMGGALAGEVARNMENETVCEKLLAPEDDTTLTPEAYDHQLISALYNATLYANYLIHQQGRSDPQFQGMGATFTAIGVTPKAVDIIQVGDSRAYLVRGGKIYQVTKDQSLVQQLIDAQQISPEEAETHTLASLALAAHDLTDTFKLLGDALVGGHDFVEGVGNLAHDADLVAGHAHGKIPHAHGLQGVKQLAKFPVFAPVDLRQARLVERAGGRTIGVRGAGDVGGLFHGNLLIPRLCGAVGIVRRGRDLT